LQHRPGWTDYEPVTDPERLRRLFGVSLPPAAPRQLALAGMDVASTRYEPASLLNEPAPLGYKLFFALFPEPLDVERLYGASTRILSAHALRQTRQSVDRLHVTLCTVHDDMLGMPQQMINAAIAAGQKIQALRLPLRLDSAASFKKHGAFGARRCVNRCSCRRLPPPSDDRIASLRHEAH
jgi:hypothetical protein